MMTVQALRCLLQGLEANKGIVVEGPDGDCGDFAIDEVMIPGVPTHYVIVPLWPGAHRYHDDDC